MLPKNSQDPPLQNIKITFHYRYYNYFFNFFFRYNILQPQFEINPAHPIIKKVNSLRSANPKLAMLVTEQLFANAMVSAGLVEDPRTILRSMNDLLLEALDKH